MTPDSTTPAQGAQATEGAGPEPLRGPRPLRVALLTPSLDPGGAERQMLILAGALPRPEFEVRFLALSARGVLAPEADRLGVRVDVLGLDRERCRRLGPGCLRDLLRAARRYRAMTRDVDVVDAWLVPAYTFAGLLRPIARTPVLLAGRRSALDVHRTRTWYREAAGRLAMRLVDGVVANSAAAADAAVAGEGVRPERVHVIHNAVLPAEGSETLRTPLRTGWVAGPDDLVVGCVSNLKPGKGLHLVLAVAETLRDRRPRLRYVLVGEGPLRGWLEAEIRRRGLDGIVVLHGGVPDARPLYGGFDVALQASDTEGLPNAVLEACAAGLPIVATAVGGTTEIVTDGVEGILVQRGDAAGLAVAVDRLAGDADLRGRLGRAAALRAGSFSPAHLARETGDLYLRLARRADRGAALRGRPAGLA